MKGKMFESEFEEAFIQLLQSHGWSNYSCGEELHRQYTDTLLEGDLRDYLKQRYASKGLNDSEYDMIVANLRNVSGVNDYLASLNAFSLYRDGFDFKFTDGRSTPFKLEYIDFNHPEHNIFRVVNQFEMHQGQENRRPDILLFVNGIPVCIIELKNPTDEKATIREAYAVFNAYRFAELKELPIPPSQWLDALISVVLRH